MRQFGTACAALELNDLARAWYKLAIAADPLDSESQQALVPADAFHERAALERLTHKWTAHAEPIVTSPKRQRGFRRVSLADASG